MRVESVSFQREKGSKAEKGIMITGTVHNNDVNIVFVDELGEVVPKTHNWNFNHELCADYDVTRPSFTDYKDMTGEKVEVGRMDCFDAKSE